MAQTEKKDEMRTEKDALNHVYQKYMASMYGIIQRRVPQIAKHCGDIYDIFFLLSPVSFHIYVTKH